MAFVVAILIGFHTAATNNHQAMHHAQDTAHLAINGVWGGRAELATVMFPMGGQRLGGAVLATVGGWGGRADLAAVTFPMGTIGH
ncbi:MAG: hypothetical protein M1399_09285 [Actinobacteria bacterium]|nr:hypothetical protein [Actinomycetota bacterium]MCL5447311.1 hypothetical protein [Actinomycetota bacterium]